ncbi:MAG: hypothetical protein NTV80_03035 [Verrucomicrobia bacterium]|nr:hypothetical protein [Verrucomicrobiota bacterium]
MKPLTYCFLALPLLCIIFYFAFHGEEPRGKGVSPEKSLTQQPIYHQPDKRQIVEEKLAALRLKESQFRQQAIEHEKTMAKLAGQITPEIQKKLTDGVIRGRLPHYKELFESWKLTPLVADKVVSIIHEREYQLATERTRHTKTGGNGDTNRLYEKMANDALISGRHQDLLSEILTQEQRAELTQLDQKLRRPAKSKSID